MLPHPTSLTHTLAPPSSGLWLSPVSIGEGPQTDTALSLGDLVLEEGGEQVGERPLRRARCRGRGAGVPYDSLPFASPWPLLLQTRPRPFLYHYPIFLLHWCIFGPAFIIRLA